MSGFEFFDTTGPHEARPVRAAGGEVWNVERPGQWLVGAAAGHVSEQEMQSAEFWQYVDVSVRNRGMLDELRETAAREFSAWEGRR